MEMVIQQNKSGRFMGWLVGREDILCSAETEDQLKIELEKMYKAVIEYESEQELDPGWSCL